MKLPSTLPFVRRSRLIAPASVIGLGLFGLAAWSLGGRGFAVSASSNSSVFVRPGAARRGGDSSALGAVSNGVVSWVHIGDLHIQTADMQNYKDFQSILQELNQEFAGGVNFAVLPGDNANEGSDSEYQLIGEAIKSANLKVPLYAIKGDHDEKSTDQAFEQYLYPKPYYSQDVAGYHLIFLEAMNNSGANSLTQGSTEWNWFASDLRAASAAGKQSVLVMHPFFLNQLPDLTDFQSLVQQNHVIMVDSGHTHTNDLANDGHIIYAATRSTGQDTEGAVGVSVATIDHGIISWKFDPLGQFPFVEITSPGDSPLITSAAGNAHGDTTIDARAFSTAAIVSASYQIDGGPAVSMTDSGSDLWTASWDSTRVSAGEHKLVVTVKDQAGKTATDSILTVVNQSDTYSSGNKSFGPASNLLLATNADIAAKGIVVTNANQGGGPPPGGAPGGRPAGGPRGMATIVSLSSGTLTLKYTDGSTSTVVLGSGIELLKEVAASMADLTSGATVELVGSPGAPTALVITYPGATSSSPLPGPAVTATNTEIATATPSAPGAGTGVTLQSGDRILLLVLAMAILAVALIVTLGIVAAR